MARTGRRAGPCRTREQILAAAAASFTAAGYEATSVRQVAGAAGVDPALIRRFFGGKQQLFTEVATAVIRPAQALEAVSAGPRTELGERLARYFLGLLGSVTEPGPILGLVRSAVTSEHAADLLRGFLAENVLGRIVRSLGVDHPDLRAALAASQLVGLAVARHAVRLGPLASASPDDLAEWIAPALQRHLTGPAPDHQPPDHGPPDHGQPDLRPPDLRPPGTCIARDIHPAKGDQ